jgi:hypothetical protein
MGSMTLNNKVISPAALIALKEALTNIYWFKKELRGFLLLCTNDSRLISRFDWDNEYKRNIVSSLIDQLLLQNQTKVVLKILEEVVRLENYTHLERLEDGKRKAKIAKESVNALKDLYSTHQINEIEQQKIEERRKKAREKQLENNAVQLKLEEMKMLFYELFNSNIIPQSRGYKLERLLIDLFTLFDLDPKASFRLLGEQIDGSFSFHNTDFLLEAKWQKYVGIQDLDAFNGKISRKLDNTLGLFISINGYSPEAVMAHSMGKKLMILMDGGDLAAVLEGRIDLVELLLRKKRHASQTGEIYLKVNDILLG